MSKKVEYITPREFLTLPLSQAIRQVILDVKSMVSKGVELDMGTWFRTNKEEFEEYTWGLEFKGKTRICSVCLGGAAICSFVPLDAVNGYNTIDKFGEKLLGLESKETGQIITTFDNLRTGDIVPAFRRWYNIHKSKSLPWFIHSLEDWASNEHYYFRDSLDTGNIENLLQYLSTLADRLEACGY